MKQKTKNNKIEHSQFYIKGQDDFIAMLRDQFREALSYNKPVLTSFLSLPEQSIVSQICPKDLFVSFNGGYGNAERKIACITPMEELYDSDLVILEAVYNSSFRKIQHKDVLGTLMHLGLEREVIGDICIEEDRIVIFVKEQIADFIQMNCVQIARMHIQFERVDFADVSGPQKEEIIINVSSLRMDAIVASLSHCSRSEANLKIKQGFVKLNDVILETNQQLCNNDFVSIRRVGRFQYIGIVNTTKKERLMLKFEKYS
ncbi:MAG: YlmH/Sll1252 family protein [Bacillota bacterium]|nr:YlmH/Sll1252 family protein [Bacillota bacterium]